MDKLKERIKFIAYKPERENLEEWAKKLVTDIENFYKEIVLRTNFSLGNDGSVAWNPGNIANGAEEAKEVTVTGAALGDFVIASFSLDISDLQLTANVTAADTVTCVLSNNTGGAVNLSGGTLRARVFKQ